MTVSFHIERIVGCDGDTIYILLRRDHTSCLPCNLLVLCVGRPETPSSHTLDLTMYYVLCSDLLNGMFTSEQEVLRNMSLHHPSCSCSLPLPQQQHVPILDWAMPSAYTSKGRTHMLPNPQSEGERQPTPSLSVMGGRNKCFSRSHEVMGMFISQPTQEKQTVGIFVSQHHQPKQTDTAANQPPS